MILFKKSHALCEYLQQRRERNEKIGFVPTMGALHEGHLSLLEASTAGNDCTVCSIFVNPTQFNDPADFKKYPVTLEKDISLIEHTSADILFLPGVDEMYPDGLHNLPHYDVGEIEHLLEGRYRPGHFQGVCQVMHRLLNIVNPDNLYMGQKDYQQCMVVKKLLELTAMGAVLNTCPTLREPDGLARSSRNLRLKEQERSEAVFISKALLHIKENLQPGPLHELVASAENILTQHHFKTDYVSIADAGTLEPVTNWNGKQKLVALVAAYMNDVRLIDNMIFEAKNELAVVTTQL